MMNQVGFLPVSGKSQCPYELTNEEPPTPITLTEEQREALKRFGGEPLPGSGFEEEEPEENFL